MYPLFESPDGCLQINGARLKVDGEHLVLPNQLDDLNEVTGILTTQNSFVVGKSYAVARVMLRDHLILLSGSSYDIFSLGGCPKKLDMFNIQTKNAFNTQ